MKKENNLHAVNMKEIFLSVLILISMLPLVDIEVSGIRLGVFLFFFLTIIYIGYEIVSMRNGKPFPLQLRNMADIAVLTLIGWNLLSIIGILLQVQEEDVPDYQFQVTCITLSLLYFLFKDMKEFKDWYFDLILYSGLAVMGFMLYCYLCDMQMAGIFSEIMADSGKNASYVLILCAISVHRYIMCRDKTRALFYALISAIGFFVLLINYNIASLWLMTVFFLATPILMRPTAELVKRNMQLCFVFLFMMSNMSLLTNYTELIDKEMSLSLEHSVYLDLLIAVGGVFFFKYWDKIPEKINREKLIMIKMRRGFIFVLKLVGIVFLIFVMGGGRWKKLPDTMGTSMVKSFAVPLVNEIGNSKNTWIYCIENSSISVLILLIFTVLLIRRLIINYSFAKSLTSSFLILAIVFFMETFFFVPSINVLPIHMLILVMAAFYQEEEQRVVTRKINL